MDEKISTLWNHFPASEETEYVHTDMLVVLGTVLWMY